MGGDLPVLLMAVPRQVFRVASAGGKADSEPLAKTQPKRPAAGGQSGWPQHGWTTGTSQQQKSEEYPMHFAEAIGNAVHNAFRSDHVEDIDLVHSDSD
eukprot:4047245-Pyramimonas_sp.AAC.2